MLNLVEHVTMAGKGSRTHYTIERVDEVELCSHGRREETCEDCNEERGATIAAEAVGK